MAHIQSSYLKLWKPQDLTIDKISSQKMFIDNIDLLEGFALSVLKRTASPVASLEALKNIDTSDTVMYSDGMTIMVKSSGIYFFDRGSTENDNGKTIIAPINGGGRWISDTLFITRLDTIGNVPNVTTNNQTPTYTQASTLATLVSGEKLSVSMGKIMKAITDLISHITNKSNPHNVTKKQVGLGNVDNTSDANKPISSAVQTALDKCAKIEDDGEVGSKRFGRLTGFAALNGINLNNIKFTGQYSVMSNCTNRPVTGTSYDMLEVIMYSSHWLIQRYYVLNDAGVISGIYYRSYTNNATWSSWSLYNMGTANTLVSARVIDEEA